MKHKIKSLSLLAASLFGVAGNVSAGSDVTVVLKGGDTVVVEMEDSGFIFFSDGNLLNFVSSASSSAVSSYPLHKVQKLLFAENNAAPRVLAANEMALYPAVASSQVFLANMQTSQVAVEIFNAQGALVASLTVADGQGISVANLPAGNYVLKADGSTFKFLKK